MPCVSRKFGAAQGGLWFQVWWKIDLMELRNSVSNVLWMTTAAALAIVLPWPLLAVPVTRWHVALPNLGTSEKSSVILWHLWLSLDKPALFWDPYWVYKDPCGLFFYQLLLIWYKSDLFRDLSKLFSDQTELLWTLHTCFRTHLRYVFWYHSGVFREPFWLFSEYYWLFCNPFWQILDHYWLFWDHFRLFRDLCIMFCDPTCLFSYLTGIFLDLAGTISYLSWISALLLP